VCAFVEKNIRITNIDDVNNIYADLIKVFKVGANDMNGDVRDSALTVIGIILGRLKVSGSTQSETNAQTLFSDLNP
jgi:hypothetical protein